MVSSKIEIERTDKRHLSTLEDTEGGTMFYLENGNPDLFINSGEFSEDNRIRCYAIPGSAIYPFLGHTRVIVCDVKIIATPRKEGE